MWQSSHQEDSRHIGFEKGGLSGPLGGLSQIVSVSVPMSGAVKVA